MATEAFGEQWRRRQEIDKPVKGCPKAVLRKDAFGRFQCSKFCSMGSFQSKLAVQAATDATLRLKSRKAVEKDTRRGLNIENEASMSQARTLSFLLNFIGPVPVRSEAASPDFETAERNLAMAMAMAAVYGSDCSHDKQNRLYRGEP